jgi:hypothetical protein
MSNPKSKIQQQNDARAAEKAARHQQIMEADYSAATTLDELWQDLSTDEIKALSRENATFRMRQSELDNEPLPQTQTLAASPGEAAAMVDSERVAAALERKRRRAPERRPRQKNFMRVLKSGERTTTF